MTGSPASPPPRVTFRDLRPLVKVVFVISNTAVLLGVIALAVAAAAAVLIVLGLLGHGVAAVWS